MHAVRASSPVLIPAVAKTAALALCVALGACATVQRGPSIATSATVRPVAEDQDALLKALTAQFALQRNDLPAAAKGFTAAAQLSSDPAISEEATRLALSAADWSLARQALARWEALAPQDPGIKQSRAWIALGEKRIDAAFADLDALAVQGDDQSWRLIAQTLLGAKDKQTASRLLDRLAIPQRLGAKEANWIAVSQLAFKLDDMPLAQNLADAAMVRFRGADSYAWSARLALERGDKATARAIYADALRRDPGNLRLRNGYAALLADAGDNAGAARVLARGPQDDVTYGARAAYAARLSDKTALAALYAEVKADKSERSDKRLYLLGQLSEMLGRQAEALAWYEQVSDSDDHWFDAQVRQVVMLDQLGRSNDAFALLHRLEELAAGSSEELGNVFLLEAEMVGRKGSEREVEAVYQRAFSALPDDPRLLYARGLFTVEHGDFTAGERDLRRLIELKPDSAEAMNALGYTLADRSKRGDPSLQEALDLIQRALKLKPDEPAIIDSLGWVRYRMGDLDQSVTALRSAYAKQPDPDIAAHLGEVLWVKGSRDEARRVWNEAKHKDPKNKTLLETMQRLMR